ncbi:MAG: L-fucose:H+ symporter permease, partial [Bacteroidales bacterium]|nr:L-fucose:H+ symporter permease [Bacteroidales bacterium]
MVEEKPRVIPKGIGFAFALLTILFFAWAVPNNMTDTMLAAFKRIMSLTDAKTAWIQVVCYFLGYGCLAVPAAMYIQKHTYKSGVQLGLAVYAIGALLFYPAMKVSAVNVNLGFYVYLLAIFVLFSGLSILETSTNSFICAIGDERTATQRLNFAQSFNPFGAITGVVVSQVFVLSQLNTKSAAERAAMSPEELAAIQAGELNAVTMTYVVLGIVMLVILLAIALTRMPALRESGKLDVKGSFGRLIKNRNYVWGVVAQFFYVGAQIAVWSYVIRYSMHALNLDGVIAGLGSDATSTDIINALRNIEPVSAGFYNFVEWLGVDALLPRTAEQAGATFYIMSLILFVTMRFVCTFLMKYIKPRKLLSAIAVLAVACCL